MGILDLFFRKSPTEPPEESLQESASPGRFFLLYREYLAIFLRNQLQGNGAPLAAYQDHAGRLHGLLYTFETPDKGLAVPNVLHHLTTYLAKRVVSGEIRSYLIIYHADADSPSGVPDFRINPSQANAVALRHWVEKQDAPKVSYLRYQLVDGKVRYFPLENLTATENDQLFQMTLRPGHEYFDKKIPIERQEETTPNGIQWIHGLSGGGDLLLGGFFGFPSWGNGSFEGPLERLMQEMSQEETDRENGFYEVFGKRFGELELEWLSFQKVHQALVPVLPQAQVVDMKVAKLVEWEGANGAVGTVIGNCNGQFMLPIVDLEFFRNKKALASNAQAKLRVWGLCLRMARAIDEPQDELDRLMGKGAVFLAPQPENWESGVFDFRGRVDLLQEVSHGTDFLPTFLRMDLCVIHAVEGHPPFTVQIFVSRETIKGDLPVVGEFVIGSILFLGKSIPDPSTAPI